MPVVSMPNGDKVRFPDDMPKDQIRDFITQKFPDAFRQADTQTQFHGVDLSSEQKERVMGRVEQLPQGPGQFLRQGSLAGFSDEIGGAIAAPRIAFEDWKAGRGFDLGRAYDEGVAMEREVLQRSREAAPGLSTAAEVAGSIASVPAKAPTVARSMAQAGGLGFAHGFGRGEGDIEERVERGLESGAIGAATAGTLDVAGRGLSSLLAKRAANQARKGIPAQSTEQLSKTASEGFERLNQSGVSLPASAGMKASNNIDMLMRKTTPRLAPQAFGLKRVVERALGQNKPVNITDWHNLSKDVNRVARDFGVLSETDEYYVGLIKRQVDSLRKSRLQGSGKMNDAMREWTKANELSWTAAKREIIDDIINKSNREAASQTSRSQVSQTLSKNFKQLSLKKDLMRTFTPAEQKMITRIADAETVPQMVNIVKKFDPTSPMGLMLGQAISWALFGGVLPQSAQVAVPIAAGGTANILANRAAATTAQNLADDISRGIAPIFPTSSLPSRGAVPLGVGAGSQSERLLKEFEKY